MSQLVVSPVQSLTGISGPILLIGAAYAGKSELAHQTLIASAPTMVIGTADLNEGFLRARVQELRKQRPEHWQDIQGLADLGAQIKLMAQTHEQILLDSINQWVANQVLSNMQKYSLEQLSQHIEFLAQNLVEAIACLPSNCRLVIVSSEVGAGISPPRPVARTFRQLVGRINCRLATVSNSVLWVSAGIPLLIKGQWPLSPQPLEPSAQRGL